MLNNNLIHKHLLLMKLKQLFLLTFIAASITVSNACTNLLVAKGASVDGSTMITYSADSYWLYGALYHQPAATYPAGSMRKVYEWDTGKYLGEIPQVAQTYNVVGNMNEHQLSISETTFTGLKELIDTSGLIDYGSLIYITLQRAKTAREAIVVMTNLVKDYGYYSSGESFSIADPNEVWIMEMIGKGVGNKGAVWVAMRIPDDCVSAHANQARITTFPLQSKKNPKSISSKNISKIYNPEVEVVYAADVISFARTQGLYEGTDADFSFSDTYNPLDFGGLRFCEARVWTFFRQIDPSINRFYSYINGETRERMPLWVKPTHKLSARDLMRVMRDHYEGTELDMTVGAGSGPYNTVFRPSPLTYKVDGVEYYHERPIGTQQTGFTFIAQMRNWLPNPIGGILWFGCDDATTNVYVPIYCDINTIPESFSEKNGSLLEFSWTSAFWVNNWVGNMTYNRYSDMIKEVNHAQNKLESYYKELVDKNDKEALELWKKDPNAVSDMLTAFSLEQADLALTTWKRLGERLLVKFLDGVTKGEKDGKFEQNDKHIPERVIRPGYNEDFNRKEFVTPHPERFRLKSDEEMKQRK